MVIKSHKTPRPHPQQTVTLTMASQADAVLLMGMAHCAEYASDVLGIELAAGG